MRNIALTLMYNGSAYHGWQVQKTEVSVAQTLERVGLDVPQVTKIAGELRRRGLPIDPAVYTIEDLKAELLALKGGHAAC